MADDMSRYREIEIDGGIQRHADTGEARVHLTLREGDGLRRTLAEVVLSDAQLVALARGGTVRVSGSIPVEFNGGDALVDALDMVTSSNGRRTDRSPREIGTDLLDQLTHARDDAPPVPRERRGSVPYAGQRAVERALRATTPRPLPGADRFRQHPDTGMVQRVGADGAPVELEIDPMTQTYLAGVEQRRAAAEGADGGE